MPRRNTDGLDVIHAVALGALHGPAELLPISSSGHVALVPWLLDWPYSRLDPELRKAFEVALHAGTAAALVVALRDEVADAVLELDGRRGALILLSSLPPAACALLLERPIERRLGTPATIAAGLLLGSAAMLIADGAPQERGREDAGPGDALWLGVAQATALMPGVSRNGATLVAARLRRFRREDANVLSRHVALPIILAASALKGKRLARRGLPPGARVAFAAGVAASFASTLASTWLIRQVERDRSLMPYAAYRTALAGVVLVRTVRKNRKR
ncbi:MAG TPA: undecaprenyl-diphosphate phosphatase [Solirubrobacteraceae bacterium]|jgi:undecaprenyl-diphosphatase|nr:undecaprenyl-diphosphate phosphatase [Solirubrobacteraceae bacterium]